MSDKEIQSYRLKSIPDGFDGRIQLYLSGFRRQSIIDIEDILTAVEQIPAWHLVGLKKLEYDPERKFREKIDYGRWIHIARSKGIFDQNNRKILIFQFDQLDHFLHILYHEIGHYVFYFVLNSRAKKQWVTEVYPNSMHISDYASRNASEDFAETYAAYVLRPKKLRQLYKKYEFMDKKVFQSTQR